MVTISPHHVPDIRIYPLSKLGSLIPELPSRSIDYHEKSKFITSIHKSRVLWIMGVPDHFQSCISQLLRIPPVHTVRKCIAYNSKILMAIGSNQWSIIRFPIEPETVFSFKFDTAYTNTTFISINRISVVILYIYMQLIQIRRIRRPKVRVRNSDLIGNNRSLLFSNRKFVSSFTNLFSISIQQFIDDPPVKRLFTVISNLYIQ